MSPNDGRSGRRRRAGRRKVPMTTPEVAASAAYCWKGASSATGLELGSAESLYELLLGHVGAPRDVGVLGELVELVLGKGVELAVSPARLPAGAALASVRRLEARPERRHEVRGRLGLRDGLGVNLLALSLGLDDLAERVAVGVAVIGRIEGVSELLDQLRGHFQLVLIHLRRLRS